MRNFKQFLKEGGNAVINNQEASYIDLEKINRSKIAKDIYDAIQTLNDKFKKEVGIPLWTDVLLSKRSFMSGSSLTFFDQSISDDEYVKYKKKVGDVDLQVDVQLQPKVRAFLEKNENNRFGKCTLVGVKTAMGDTDISIWRFDEYDLNIQVDFEYVQYDAKGFPTEWSMFSRSSMWADMKQGIKGVAHKLMLRALNYPHAKKFIRAAKTERSKEKEMTDYLYAFSVSKGLRAKYAPVYDENDKQLYKNGLPVFRALETKDSKYETNLESLFTIYFGQKPSGQEKEQFKSFTGLIELTKKYYSSSKQSQVVDGFAKRLWDRKSGAQGLYRGDPKRDFNEKTIMFDYIADQLGGSRKEHQTLIDEFYKNYKT
jgi:hypothetical protein